MVKMMFSMVGFQDTLIEKLCDIELNGVGGHKPRSRCRALRNARKALVHRGYSEDGAAAIVKDAVDMFNLQRIADDDSGLGDE